MEPFFFGSKNTLYGAYHPPAHTGNWPETAVVICQSIGHEYMRAHRSFWQIAEAAAQRNAHVLRFDYFATGDSEGRQSEGDWAQWQDDVKQAIEYLSHRSGLTEVRLLGMRVGALIAAHAAPYAGYVRRVILWDPVFDGHRYMRTTQAMHAEYTRRNNRYRANETKYAEADIDEYLGFHYPDNLVTRLEHTQIEGPLADSRINWQLASANTAKLPSSLRMAIEASGGKITKLSESGGWNSLKTQYRRLALPRSIPTLVDLMTEI